MSSDAPLQQTLHGITAEIALEGATKTVAINKAPFAGRVVSVAYIPNATITGKATDFRTLSIVNKGAAGEGATTVASQAFSEAGKKIAAFVAGSIPLSETAANLLVKEGDVLVFGSALSGKGIVDPGGAIVVTLARS